MNWNHWMLTAVGIVGLTGTVRADVNEVVEGTYSTSCERLTLSAGVFETTCETTPNSFLCGADWVGQPFRVQIPCGVGDLSAEAVTEIVDLCRTSDLAIYDAEGNVLRDVDEQICDAVEGFLTAVADDLESRVNGTFDINVATSSWISTMTGKFESTGGQVASAKYLTANSPWSKKFSFATGAAVPANLEISGVCQGGAAVSLVSGGNVVKATGALTLDYNLNGTAMCGAGDEALTISVNLHADLSGEKL